MAESVDALVSNTNGRKFVPVRSRLWVQWSAPHYDHQTIVGIALLAVGLWCFYTFYYLRSEENRPLIGGATEEKGRDSVLLLAIKKNFLCSSVKVLSPRMEMGLPYSSEAICWYTRRSLYMYTWRMRYVYVVMVVFHQRSLINFIDLFGSIKKCRTFVVCFSWY